MIFDVFHSKMVISGFWGLKILACFVGKPIKRPFFDAKKGFYGYFMGVGPFLKIGAGWYGESESAQKPLFLMLKRYYGDL